MSDFICCPLCDRRTGVDDAGYVSDEENHIMDHMKKFKKLSSGDMICRSCSENYEKDWMFESKINKLPNCDFDVLDMVNGYLKEHGFDGLYNRSYECACVLGDISPGLCMETDCLAGYKNKCNDECSHEGKGDWHMSGDKYEDE